MSPSPAGGVAGMCFGMEAGEVRSPSRPDGGEGGVDSDGALRAGGDSERLGEEEGPGLRLAALGEPVGEDARLLAWTRRTMSAEVTCSSSRSGLARAGRRRPRAS